MESSNIILPVNLLSSSSAIAGVPNFDIEITENGIDLDEVMKKIEKIMIEKALQKAKGSKTKAAELLHVTFDSLRYRMEKLGVE
jgi:two-component system response regulator PilR (NtrC family)